jgi:hypothetical protein
MPAAFTSNLLTSLPFPLFVFFFDFLQASYLFLLLQLLAGWPFQAAYFSFHM